MCLNEFQIELFWKQKIELLFESKNIYSNSSYFDRINFIKPILDKHILTGEKILDYGCGLGEFNEQFKHYVGVDINERSIKYCKHAWPNKQFSLITLYQQIKDLSIDTFFSSECLQYNDDESVEMIIDSLPNNIKNFYIYETSNIDNYVTKKRSSINYHFLFSKRFRLTVAESRSHMIKGNEYTLTIFKKIDT